ncbi:MAG: hypothetical protein M3Q07_26065 [Pseudobdellovibrionaceae bacterium]|nr:hypothetical protein [Pseudobdellovibrionaceae bacterium]
MKKFLLVLPLFAACSPRSLDADLDNIRSNKHVVLAFNTFYDDVGFPGIESKTVPLVLVKQSKDADSRTLAFAIDCGDKDPGPAYAAFGIAEASTAYDIELTYEELVAKYGVDKQPVIKCSSLGQPLAHEQQVRAIFRVVQDGPDLLPYPDYLIKFSGFEDDFYSVGCQEFLDAFGFKQDLSFTATPVLASTLNKVFPSIGEKGDGYKEINCMSATQPLPPPTGPVMKKGGTFFSRSTDLFMVEVRANKKKYVLVSNGLSYDIECPSVPENEILAAFHFAPTYKVQKLELTDARFTNRSEQPALRCQSPVVDRPFVEQYVTLNETPGSHYVRVNARDNTLLRFGCDEPRDLFTDSPSQDWTAVTRESIDFLVRDFSSPTLRTRVLDIPCKGRMLVAELNALNDGEVISLRQPSAPKNQQWLEGNTSNGSVQQIALETSGIFWRVSKADASDSFHLQSLGLATQARYLACSDQDDSLRLVKSSAQPGYQTRWSVFRSEQGLRFGCRNAADEWRMIDGSKGNPVLTKDDNLEAATSWAVRHHAFREDKQLFKQDAIVSFASILTEQGQRWLAAFPEQRHEIGLETSQSPNSTHFKILVHPEGKGFSLKSMNSESGERILECNTKGGEEWYQLTSHEDLYETQTTFKVYRLSDTQQNFVKLVCTNAAGKPYWMAITGQYPWMDLNPDPNVSHADALLHFVRQGQQ